MKKCHQWMGFVAGAPRILFLCTFVLFSSFPSSSFAQGTMTDLGILGGTESYAFAS
jgi:hypothetical protein